MSVTIKSDKQIELMRESGRLLAIMHEELHKAIRPGISTLEIDRLGEKSSVILDVFRILKIITDIRHPSVYPSMTRLYTAFQQRSVSYRTAISSVLMQDLFTKAGIQMLRERGASEISQKKPED